MSEVQNENLAETTNQDAAAGQTDEQLQEAVNGNEEAALQEGGEGQQESQAQQTPAWVQRRFNEMTRARHEAERREQEAIHRAATAEQLARAMQNQGGTDSATQQQPVYQQPQVSDETRIQQAAQQRFEEHSFNTRSNEVYGQGKAEYPDFDDAMRTLGMLGVGPDVFRGLVGMEDSHKVLHALGSNPEEAERILSLPPLQQGRELERLAQKPAKVAPKKPVSQAPAPISTVDGKSGGSIDLNKASIDDFMKARNSQAPRR